MSVPDCPNSLRVKMSDSNEKAFKWKGVCAYDGTDFEGWQSQPCGNTIQDILEARLAEVFKHSIRIHGSARTDSGVHAKQQVFHFELHLSIYLIFPLLTPIRFYFC